MDIDRKHALLALFGFILVLSATLAYLFYPPPAVHDEPENTVIRYDVERYACGANVTKDAHITAGEFLSNGAREVHVEGTWLNRHQGNNYPVELRKTGNQTLMMLMQRETPQVENGSACMIRRGEKLVQGVWGMNYSAVLHIDPDTVETLRVYYNGEQVGMKRQLDETQH